MSNRTYICFPCRIARREIAAYGRNTDFRCASCSGTLIELEHRWRIPPKKDDKSWKALEIRVARKERERLTRRTKVASEKIAKLDRVINAANARKSSNQKELKLRTLRKRRSKLEKDYAYPVPNSKTRPAK